MLTLSDWDVWGKYVGSRFYENSRTTECHRRRRPTRSHPFSNRLIPFNFVITCNITMVGSFSDKTYVLSLRLYIPLGIRFMSSINVNLKMTQFSKCRSLSTSLFSRFYVNLKNNTEKSYLS